MNLKISHIGAESTVTGSCHLLQTGGVNILIDCGMTQGADTALPMDQWPVSPSAIDFLFLTHAHIDHIGRVPELIRRGFTGEIICTHGTRALLEPMLEDALRFTQLSMNRDEKERLLSSLEELSWGFEYLESFSLRKGIRFTLGRAGHILGSCWIRFDLPDGKSLVFSGDLGAENTPILPDPDIPESCDLLVLESTYGDRCHEDRGRRVERLARILKKALADRGKVLIPAFALGRTQELIYEMNRLFSDPDSPSFKSDGGIPVFIDTPLGLNITQVYARLSEFWDREATGLLEKGDDPLDFDHLYGATTHTDHLKLLDLKGPAIIIAGSGMCTGGRIIDHLKAGLDDPTTDILFPGYQANRTPGRDILTFAEKKGGYVTLDGDAYPIRAAVQSLSGYSAHADQRGLLAWATAIQPGQVKLVHGEPGAQHALKNLLRERGVSTV
ncbi:MAG: MBL fold metallo-hydrolase [Pseudomonadota bacterium]